MKENLTGTDIRWIAKGYWDQFFEWKFIGKVKQLLILSTAFFVALIAFGVIGSLLYEDAPPEHAALMIGLFLFCVGTLCAAMFEHFAARSTFIIQAVARWESGDKEIPSLNSVHMYLKDNDLWR